MTTIRGLAVLAISALGAVCCPRTGTATGTSLDTPHARRFVPYETIAHKMLKNGDRIGHLPAYHVKTGTAPGCRPRGRPTPTRCGRRPSRSSPSGSSRGTRSPSSASTGPSGSSRRRGDGGRAVPAGIYTTCSPTECRYIVDHSEAPSCSSRTRTQSTRSSGAAASSLHLRHDRGDRCGEASDDPMVMTWDEFMAAGAEVDDAALDAAHGRARGEAARHADLHVGHHRPAQGRDAVARQPRLDPAQVMAPLGDLASTTGCCRTCRCRTSPSRCSPSTPPPSPATRSTSPSRSRRSPTTSRRSSPRCSSACRGSGRSSTPGSTTAVARPPAPRKLLAWARGHRHAR